MINKYPSLPLSTRYVFLYLLSIHIDSTKSKRFQLDYTIGPGLNGDDYHIQVVRGVMTRNIGTRYSDMLDEIDKTLDMLLAGADQGIYQCIFLHLQILRLVKAG